MSRGRRSGLRLRFESRREGKEALRVRLRGVERRPEGGAAETESEGRQGWRREALMMSDEEVRTKS